MRERRLKNNETTPSRFFVSRFPRIDPTRRKGGCSAVGPISRCWMAALATAAEEMTVEEEIAVGRPTCRSLVVSAPPLKAHGCCGDCCSTLGWRFKLLKVVFPVSVIPDFDVLSLRLETSCLLARLGVSSAEAQKSSAHRGGKYYVLCAPR